MLTKLIPLAFVLILILISSCSVDDETHVFKINGKIENPIDDEFLIFYLRDLELRKFIPIDTINTDESGNFSAKYNYEPGAYALGLFGEETISLAIDTGQVISIDVKLNKDGDNILVITGSPDTDLLNEYEVIRKKTLEEIYYPVRDSITALSRAGEIKEIEKLAPQFTETKNIYKSKLTEFVREKMGTSVAVYYTSLRWDGDKNLEFFESLVSRFEEERPALKISKLLRKKVEKLKSISIGGIAPEISMPDSLGNIISLSLLKGKYVLIDYWASWCPPCRQESPLLVEYYNKYKSKGFEIYSISMDTKRGNWLKAVKADGLLWSQVSDLQGWKDPQSPAHEYDITEIPTNFLINPEGKIVAKRLRGEMLGKKLEEIFTSN